jgi:hypothetical protein
MSEYTLSVIEFFNLPYAQVFPGYTHYMHTVTHTMYKIIHSADDANAANARAQSKAGTEKLGQGNCAKIQNDFLFSRLPFANNTMYCDVSATWNNSTACVHTWCHMHVPYAL